MKNVYYIFETPVLELYKKFFAFQAFVSKGYTIKIMDISPITNKIAFESTTTSLMDYEELNIIRCFTYKEIEKEIDSILEGSIVFTIFSYKPNTVRIIRMLAKRNLKYGMMVLNGSAQIASPKYSWMKKLRIFLQSFSFQNVMLHILVRVPHKLMCKSCADFFIYNAGSEQVFRRTFYCDGNTQFLRVHSMMYEEALKNINMPRLIKDKYIVYLDTYDPYHPDLKSYGRSIEIDARQFYSTLRRFLKRMEKIYGMNVVIAAHPRSDYGQHPEALEGFEIIKENTELLVKDCEFAITIGSTSFLYAILYHKPLIMISMKAVDFKKVALDELARRLKRNRIEIDELDEKLEREVEEELTIDEGLYETFFKDNLNPFYSGTIEGESYYGQIVDFVEKCGG